jgi:hypothetical protein
MFLLEMIGIDLSEMLPLFRKVILREDGLDRASGLARPTIYTFVGMDVKKLG